MIRSKKFISVLLAMVMVLSIACLCASAETKIDTTSRGYKLIDGDVYDLNDNLLIKMDNGFTKDGYTLDPNFTVYYPSNVPADNNRISENSIRETETKDLPSAETEIDTRSRGYKLIDGDVYDGAFPIKQTLQS